jgi:hypothetical protein
MLKVFLLELPVQASKTLYLAVCFTVVSLFWILWLKAVNFAGKNQHVLNVTKLVDWRNAIFM